MSDDGSKKKAKPESQDLLVSIKLEKDGGYIVFSKLGDLWVAKENLTEVKSGFKKVDTPVFPADPRWKPSPDDVRQTGLGDCYLEAALASIAAQKPDYIKEIVREDQDSNVTVRLYKVDQTDYQNPKFTPQYIKVEKSVPINRNGVELYNNGALWVRMIQKAYAAGCFTGTGLAPISKTPAYENMDGGLSSYAFEVLLGKPSTTLDLKSGPTYNKNKKQYEERQDIVAKDNTKQIITPNKVSLPWDAGAVTEYDQVKYSKTPDDYSSMKLLMGIFKNDQNKVDQWITFLKGVKGNNLKQKFVDQSHDRASIDIRDNKLEGNSNAITLKDIDELFKNQAFKDDMMQWLQAQQIFPGESGTAIYSQTQLDTFEKIKVALNGGQVVAASSYSSIGKGTGVEEKTPDGVSSGHAYSVLAVRTTNSQNPEDQKVGKFHWVKLCNPWQKNGRKSRFPNGKLEVIEDQANDTREFWLELSDLTKYYYRIDIGSFPNK
ncbi:C2 family cysteine protease [Cylindrospermum stagnale]|uniref:C2 family cysteine protease n=1 Tax=Cylindrospermum stagnale TaxID=142864 RepID=UPI00155B2B31|nr:C2 family cysteine protease [Cylindrospermum stagnale]